MDRQEPNTPHAEIASPNGPITLDLDHSGNGPRLRVGARSLDRAVFLDPLELEALTWAPEEVFQVSPAEPAGVAEGGEPAPAAFAIDIANEFARVTVELEHGGGEGPRLKIGAARLHRVLCLDPRQLEALTAVEPTAIEALLATPFGPEADDVPDADPGPERD